MERDDKRRTDAGLQRKAATLGSILAAIALVVGSLFGDRGFLHLMNQREKVGALQREIEQLRGDNSELADQIVALRSDPRAIERIAREQLGLAAPGETVFLLRPEDAPGPR